MILAFPIGLSVGAILPTFNSMIFKRCSPERRGTASGAYFAAIDIGFALGAPLLGALADALDHGYIYRAGAVSVTLALILYLSVCSDKRYKARQARKEGVALNP
jgi:predicted MFS family arabinose efflux permease